MKITVSRENYTIENSYIKLAEFYDYYTPTLFIKALLDESEESGSTKILVEVAYKEVEPVSDDRYSR